MNWLLIIVGIVLLIGVINGYIKGAIRLLVSLVTTVATIAIVFYVSPYVSDAMVALTPLDEVIEGTCHKSFVKMAEASTELLESYGTSSEEVFGDNKVELPRNLQIELIEKTELPEAFKELLLSNNNNEVYEMLGVNTFVEYISKYLAKLIIDILSYLLTFLIVTIVIRAIVFALDIVSFLPLLGTLNRLSGALIGALLALIIIWFAFVVITLVYSTTIGTTLMNMIASDKWLTLIYKMNPIMQMMTMLR